MATTKVNSEFIAVNAISGTIIADGAITSTHLAANCVDTAELVTGSIDTIHIAANQVTSAKIVSDAVLTRHIADDQVTQALIAVNSVGISELAVTDGSNGQALTTNGSGTLSFSTISGGVDGISTSADATAITIDSSERVGIGTTSPDVTLHVANAGDAYFKVQNTSASKNFQIITGGSGARVRSDDALIFDSGSSPAERMRVASNGNVGIGITNPSHVLSVYKAGDGQTPVRFNTGNNEPLDFYNDSETWKIGAAQGIGFMAKSTGLITFYTTDSETECARWTNNRAFKTKQGTSAYANATSNYNEICSNADATANLLVRQGSTYYADCINLWYYASTGPNNTHSNFLNAFDEQGTRAKIFSNGGFANYQSNNSNLCDEREKKNVVASDSTWNDVKSWNIKKFHYNEDGDSDAKRYGVIAQDIETTNPDLIVDWEKQKKSDQELWQEGDKPLPDGVSVGDVKTAAKEQIMRKAVKEQQMYMMAIKALQEAMTEIESLKARVETLEG